MMSARSLILFPILLALCACATLPQPALPASAWVAFDRMGETDAGSSGLADRAGHRRLTADDRVRIASVSKLVVALGVMRLVEAGTLDLDRDVSDYLGWPLRNPAFPDRAITLRLLLSHRSSLRDGIDYAVPFGTSLQSALAAPAAFDAEHPPGAYFRYANLNFPVIASVMERAAGERFDALMARLVLRPLGLDACFNWTTCGDAAVARAVVLYAQDGSVVRDDLHGRRPVCPVLAPAGCDLTSYAIGTNGALFSPQGGLRISMRDLARVGRMLLDRGTLGRERFLSEASVRTLTTPLWRFDGTNGDTDGGFYCAYALAVQSLPNARSGCRDDLFGDGRAAFGHAGEAYGVRSGLWLDPARRRGIAYFAADLGDNPPAGRSAFKAIEERLARNLR